MANCITPSFSIFQSMVMSCNRGCEIGLTRFEHLEMKNIKEPNSLEFEKYNSILIIQQSSVSNK